MEEVVFLTEDKWVKEKGLLDTADRQLLSQLSLNGKFRVKVMNMKEVLESMKNTEPEEFEAFHKNIEKQAGKSLTYEELVKYSRLANTRIDEFTVIVAGMTQEQAESVRMWRITCHMTWRHIARMAWLQGWFNSRWCPPENQIMGMALCDKASSFFKENYREPPWN